MRLTPTWQQWGRWSLPTKITVIASYITIIWILISMITAVLTGLFSNKNDTPIKPPVQSNSDTNYAVLYKFKLSQNIGLKWKYLSEEVTNLFRTNFVSVSTKLPEKKRIKILEYNPNKSQTSDMPVKPGYSIQGDISKYNERFCISSEIVVKETGETLVKKTIYRKQLDAEHLEEAVDTLARALIEMLFEKFELKRLPVIVHSEPEGADIYVYDEKKETTGATIYLSPGKHEIVLKKVGYKPCSMTANISKRRNIVTAELEKE